MLFADRISPASAEKVRQVASALDINPDWLMLLMWHESGLNPAVRNSIGAVGLIQFMPATAAALGTTTSALQAMSFTQQMDYVYRYFLPYKSRIKNFADLCLVCFYPYALYQPSSYIIGSEQGPYYARLVKQQNPVFPDLNGDGMLSKAEWEQYIWTQLVPPHLRGQWQASQAGLGWFLVPGALFALGYYLSKREKKSRNRSNNS